MHKEALMTTTDTSTHTFAEINDHLIVPESNIDWVRSLQQAGLDQFKHHTPLNRQDEAWKYFPVSELNKRSFDLFNPSVENVQTTIATILNGVPIAPTLLQAHSLQALSNIEHHSHYKPYLKTAVKTSPLSALNTAQFQDVLVVHARQHHSEPIIINNIIQSTRALMAHPRILIVVEPHVQASIQLNTIQENGSDSLSNTVVDIHLHENADLTFTHTSRNGSGTHFMALNATIDKSARLKSHSFLYNHPLTRHDYSIKFTGPDANCDLFGLGLLCEKNRFFQHLDIHHQVPGCNSSQTFKNILTDHSLTEFTGLVNVHEKCHETDSAQLNQNLLLSDNARVLSRPQLRIDADDVLCAHGSTIGQLDPEGLYYIQSRGIGKAEAEGILTAAFVNDVVESILDESMQSYVSDSVTDYIDRYLQSSNE